MNTYLCRDNESQEMDLAKMAMFRAEELLLGTVKALTGVFSFCLGNDYVLCRGLLLGTDKHTYVYTHT